MKMADRAMWFIGPGLAISAIGWVLLVWGVTVETSSSLFARPDATAHTLAIITNVIYFGYALCIFGAIWEMPKRVSKMPSTSPESKAVKSKSSKKATEPEGGGERETHPTVDWAHVQEEFQRTFGISARVGPDGQVILLKGRGKLAFDNVDLAWDYCMKHLYDPDRASRT